MDDRRDRLAELLDRQEIYEVLTRYCRGVDRCDVELIRSVYHDDAIDDHGMFKGLGIDFAQWIVDWERENLRMGQHFIGNYSCELDGDVAHTETYCISFSEDKQGRNATVYNRYIDRFERRDGRWKIAARRVVIDLSRVDPPGPPFGEVPGWTFTFGSRDRNDPVYRKEAGEQ